VRECRPAYGAIFQNSNGFLAFGISSSYRSQSVDSAARGIRRALKPGARFATAVWSAPDKVPMISLGGEAMRTRAGLPPRQPGALDPFRLADLSILTHALEGAWFTEVRSRAARGGV
jgi:hypothetical protein